MSGCLYLAGGLVLSLIDLQLTDNRALLERRIYRVTDGIASGFNSPLAHMFCATYNVWIRLATLRQSTPLSAL